MAASTAARGSPAKVPPNAVCGVMTTVSPISVMTLATRRLMLLPIIPREAIAMTPMMIPMIERVERIQCLRRFRTANEKKIT